MNLPTKAHFINIHTHGKAHSANEWVLRNAFSVLSPAQIQKLPYAVSVGIHPWMAKEYALQHIESTLDLSNVLALGEVGLDRINGPGLSVQSEAFSAQLQLNVEYNKPVLLHIVKAYSDIIPFIKKYPFPFIFHQYQGNEQQTVQLLKYPQVWFSFGKDLTGGRPNVEAVFQSLPLDRIFLETDTSSRKIEEIYASAAGLKNVPIEVLKARIFETFETVFKH